MNICICSNCGKPKHVHVLICPDTLKQKAEELIALRKELKIMSRALLRAVEQKSVHCNMDGRFCERELEIGCIHCQVEYYLQQAQIEIENEQQQQQGHNNELVA